MKALIPAQGIERRIHELRGIRIMLSTDLARLYEVEPRTFMQAVKRNFERFPADFMFQLSEDEFSALRSQFVISNSGRGGHRYRPYAFTEQGVAMLSSVLRSPRAIQVNIEIMRAFVRQRQMLISHEDLQKKLRRLERKYDSRFRAIFEAIRRLMEPPPKGGGPIGFRPPEKTE
jgi:hypothetical protein